MRKIIVFNLVTVDGYFAGPNGEIDWHNYDHEMSEYGKKQMESFGALMFGRVTYELMANYWPTENAMDSEPVVATIMNNIPKIVFSKTLQEVKDGPLWKNVTLLNGVRHLEISKFKEEEGDDIAILGSGTIVQQLTNLGLIDEYRLIVNPVVLAKGKPLFKDIRDKINLELDHTKVFNNGNVLLSYKLNTK